MSSTADTTRPVRPARPGRTAGLALTAAVLTAALATGCAGHATTISSRPAASNAAPPAATAVTTGAAASGSASAQAKSVQIGKSVYWGGLRFDVKSAAYQPTGGGAYQVVLDTTVTNTFKTFAVRDWPEFAIDLAGTPLPGQYGNAVPPTPGASNPLTITFDGAAGPNRPFSFDGASFVLGDAALAQAVVPLGTGGREAISLKPVDLALPAGAALTSGRLTLNLKSAQLRADFGDGNGVTTLKRGQRAVLVVFDMTGRVGDAGMAVDGSFLRLKLPNGQVVGPTRAPIEALYPDRPTRQDQAAWFIFEGATDGDYTLSVTDQPAAAASLALPATGVKDSGPVS
ncbi:hypothetical protein [Kitasatospora azatica]|uniref:hypothetical protein n=1 Tax=Kitasatospora azatica TaxID=58347 RepID=UPI00056C678C|nr:hypothetical protein [Kitasatospora azatica]